MGAQGGGRRRLIVWGGLGCRAIGARNGPIGTGDWLIFGSRGGVRRPGWGTIGGWGRLILGSNSGGPGNIGPIGGLGLGLVGGLVAGFGFVNRSIGGLRLIDRSVGGLWLVDRLGLVVGGRSVGVGVGLALVPDVGNETRLAIGDLVGHNLSTSIGKNDLKQRGF